MHETLEEAMGLACLDRDAGLYEAEVAEHWTIRGVVNGGFTMMVGAAAALQGLDRHRHAISVTARYLGQVRAGRMRVRTRLVAKSRSLSTTEAVVSQRQEDGAEKDLAWLQATSTDLRPGGETRSEEDPPPLPPPQACSWAGDDRVPGAIRDHIHLCFQPGQEIWLRSLDNPGSSLITGWMGVADGQGGYQELEHDASLFLCDAVPPAVFAWDGFRAWAPTLEMTVQSRRKPAPTASGMLRFRARTRYATHGYAEEDVELWDDIGIVAISRQLLKVPPQAGAAPSRLGDAGANG